VTIPAYPPPSLTPAAVSPPDAHAATALATLDVGVACVSRDWELVYVNDAWAEMAGGVDPRDYVGRDYWAVFPALDSTPEAGVIRSTHADGVPRHFRMRYRDERIDGMFDVRVRRAAGGGLVFAVRERHRPRAPRAGAGPAARERRRRAARRRRRLDRHVRERRRRAGHRLRPRPRARAPLWEAFPALVGSQFEAAWRDTMAGRRPHAARTVPIVRRPGVVALFDAQSYPVPDGGLLVLFSEVSTRERQARELAERSAENERLRELARTMAAVADSAAVLDALCAAATTLCGAAGATVAEVLDDEARFIAVANHPPAVRGHRFPLAGTLTGRLLALEQQAAAAGPRCSSAPTRPAPRTRPSAATWRTGAAWATCCSRRSPRTARCSACSPCRGPRARRRSGRRTRRVCAWWPTTPRSRCTRRGSSRRRRRRTPPRARSSPR
jgi:hypothetical protein